MKSKCWVTGWEPAVKTWYAGSTSMEFGHNMHPERTSRFLWQQCKEWLQWLLHLCAMLGTVDQLSEGNDGQHVSVQDAHKPGVDSVWGLIPQPCSHAMCTLASNVKNGVYGNKWGCSHLTVCILKNQERNGKSQRKNANTDVMCECTLTLQTHYQ